MDKYIVYLIVDVVTGRKYIGKTCRPFRKRLQQHLYDHSTPFDRSFVRGGQYKFYMVFPINEYFMDIGEKALICRRNELGDDLYNSMIYFDMPEEIGQDGADYLYEMLLTHDVTSEYSDVLIKKHRSRWEC